MGELFEDKRLNAPFTPVVGAYSRDSVGTGIEVGRGSEFGIGPTSGAP